jgi:kynurenine formamidase
MPLMLTRLLLIHFCKNALLLKIQNQANQQITYEDIINQEINENESAVVISTEWEKQDEKETMYLIILKYQLMLQNT